MNNDDEHVRTDRFGKSCLVRNWPGRSFKAYVINRAYRNGEFELANSSAGSCILFTCYWCKARIGTSGVEGDHVVPQSLDRSSNPDLHALFREAEQHRDPASSSSTHDNWNLVLSCSECNGGSRNKNARMLRSSYAADRDHQRPRPL